ncbi:helix-turn-helix transcriptional regulator [bacterium]|nr:helix-turn-helix transcriptional regulator [bacterium]
MDLKALFGRNLKKLRQENGLTQENLAEHIGLNPRQVSKIETGEHLPSANTIEKICTTLAVLPQELFNNENVDEMFDNKKILLMKQVQNLIKDEKYFNYISLALKATKDKKALHDLILTLEGMKLMS